jgi:cytidylate kinase
MNVPLHPAVTIWLNSIPIGQRGAAISNAVLSTAKIPEIEAQMQRMQRELERLKNIVEDMRQE